MVEVKVCSFALGVDLRPLSQHLESRGIKHRIITQQDTQELFASDDDIVQINRILNGALKEGGNSPRALKVDASAIYTSIRALPITYCMVFLGIVGYILVATRGRTMDLLPWLTFVKVKLYISYVAMDTLVNTYIRDQQWWRLVTPVFLHFGYMHIIFNAMAFIEFGRRLERFMPRRWYLALILLVAIGSNSTQFLMAQSAMFGGLSGVVYGLFGALIMLHRRTQDASLWLPKGYQVMMLATLVLGPLGVINALFGVTVADHAHFSGLIFGALLGAVFPLKCAFSNK